jgi:hypothetical protein
MATEGLEHPGAAPLRGVYGGSLHRRSRTEDAGAERPPRAFGIEFTLEELEKLMEWLNVLGFSGTTAALKPALALHDSITAKVQEALKAVSPAALTRAERRREANRGGRSEVPTNTGAR